MVRRAQLRRTPGSPLISGHLTQDGPPWGWILVGAIAVVVVAGGVWWIWLR